MQDIDFLPARYLEQDANRRTHMWRVIVVAAGLGCFVGGGVYQWYRQSLLAEELASARKRHAASQALSERVAQFNQQLTAAHTKAELHAYLAHPWARTQILAALVRPLPREIDLESLEISYQATPVTVSRRDPVRPGAPAAGGAEDAPEEPTAIDLARLRKEYDERSLVVTMRGVVRDEPRLHAYMARLHQSELFIDVELSDVGRADDDGEVQSTFQARLIVLPGYGQPRGPRPNSTPGDAIAGIRPARS